MDLNKPNVDFWNGKRVLITGHTGFKGSWLSTWLTQLGAEVIGFSDAIPTDPSLFVAADVESSLTHVIGDVRDRDAVRSVVAQREPEIVFHLAAQSTVRRSYQDPIETIQTNVLGTAHLLDAVRQQPSVAATVIVTTDKCYQNKEHGRAFVEEDCLGGHDLYSASKAAAEILTAAYRSSFGRFAVASVRAGNVIGGGDWTPDRLMTDLVGSLLAQTPIRLRYPDAVRPWQHVLDPLAGYLILAQSMAEDESLCRAWNFGPTHELVASVGEVVDKCVAMWGQPVTIEKQSGDHPHEATLLTLDSTAAGEQLGWKGRLPLHDALKWTLDWYRSFEERPDEIRNFTLDQIRTYQSHF